MAEGKEKGWISLYRALEDSWLWEDKPFARGQAWIDLLLQANHKDRKTFAKGELVSVRKGSFLTSDQLLADRWGWSRKKVRTFLDTLVKEQMVELERSPKGTSLTLVNWDLYQGGGTTEEQPKIQQENNRRTTEGTTEEQQKNTNNNVNNVNNDNNVNNNNKNKYMSDSNEYRLAEYLYKHIKVNNPNAKEPNFQNWAKTFDYILRIDKRDLEEVKQLIVFCQKHSFWYKNILSADKFRKQYERLLLEKNDSKKVKYENKVYGNKVDEFNNHPQRNYDFDELEKKLLGWDQEDKNQEQT